MNITKLTKEYIEQHPVIRNSMKLGIVNYSKLSRKICSETNVKNFDAILVACRRYQEKVSKAGATAIKKASIEAKTGIASAVVDKQEYIKNIPKLAELISVQGHETATLIGKKEDIEGLRKIFKSIDVTENLAEIKVLAKVSSNYLAAILQDNGIDAEITCCGKEIIFIVDEKDISKAIEALSF